MFLALVLLYKVYTILSGEYVIDWYKKGKLVISPELNLQLLFGKKENKYENVISVEKGYVSATIQIHGEYVCIDETGILLKVCDRPTAFIFERFKDNKYLIKNGNQCVNVRKQKNKEGSVVGFLRMGRCRKWLKRKWKLVKVIGDSQNKTDEDSKIGKEAAVSTVDVPLKPEDKGKETSVDKCHIKPIPKVSSNNRGGDESMPKTVKKCNQPRINMLGCYIINQCADDPTQLLKTMSSILNNTGLNPRFDPVPLFDKKTVSFHKFLTDQFRKINEGNLSEILQDQKEKMQNGIRNVPAIDNPSMIDNPERIKIHSQRQSLEGTASKPNKRKSPVFQRSYVPAENRIDGKQKKGAPFINDLETRKDGLVTERDKILNNTLDNRHQEICIKRTDESSERKPNAIENISDIDSEHVPQSRKSDHLGELLDEFGEEQNTNKPRSKPQSETNKPIKKGLRKKKRPKKKLSIGRQTKTIQLNDPINHDIIDTTEHIHDPNTILYEEPASSTVDHFADVPRVTQTSYNQGHLHDLAMAFARNAAAFSHASPVISPVLRTLPVLYESKTVIEKQEPPDKSGDLMTGSI